MRPLLDVTLDVACPKCGKHNFRIVAAQQSAPTYGLCVGCRKLVNIMREKEKQCQQIQSSQNSGSSK